MSGHSFDLLAWSRFRWSVRPHCSGSFAVLLWAGASVAQGQGAIVGRVSSGNGGTSVAAAQVSIARLAKRVFTDSAGRYRLTILPPGEHLVVLRAVGFQPESSVVEIESDEVSVRDFVLKPAVQTLPVREVTAPTTSVLTGKMAEYHERETLGVGHFVGRSEWLKAEGGVMQTGGVLSKVPGIKVMRGSNHAWIASGRAITPKGCALCKKELFELVSRADFDRGARPACYMDVYLDGTLVFDSAHPEYGLFDVNSIEPSNIEGVEVYTSAAQTPVKYSKTANGCGVMLIWTRA